MIENLKQIIEQSQRTQRNWDLNKPVKDEDIELFKTAVSHCPTKQNRVWYNVVIIYSDEDDEDFQNNEIDINSDNNSLNNDDANNSDDEGEE